MSRPYRVLILLALLLPALVGFRGGHGPEGSGDLIPAQEPPALMVFVVVDQLRADLLDRYDAVFTGGLRRLRDEGLRFTTATHDHALTETSPGHATLSTGTHPSRHGMVRNAWWERGGAGWDQVLNVQDPEVRLVGLEQYAGSSPRRLLRSSVADWLLEAHPDSRVVSLSAKDRAAILMAGQHQGIVYWIDGEEGRFMTSTYYRTEDVEWVTRFNDGWMAANVKGPNWVSEAPHEARMLSRPDTVPYEHDRIHTFFPHWYLTPDEEARAIARDELLASLAPDSAAMAQAADSVPEVFGEAGQGSTVSTWWDGFTPGPDEALMRLARVAVAAEEMGQDGVPDLLMLSFSQVDRIGHQYGPISREQLETLLRLDRVLGDLMDFLDENVGEGRYVMSFSADHGVMDMPEYRAETGRRGERIPREAVSPLEVALGEVVRARASEGPGAVAEGIVEVALQQPWVEQAWTRDFLASSEPADSFAVLFRNSFHPDRPAGILSRFGVDLMYPEGVLDWAWPEGTHHGSPYYYDRHVPLVFFGGGIAPGVVDDPVATIDVAPTVAEILGIPAPDDLDGRSLLSR